MMEETKRRAEVVELAEKLWISKCSEEYSYRLVSKNVETFIILCRAFEDAEAFIKLKTIYLKEGKIC